MNGSGGEVLYEDSINVSLLVCTCPLGCTTAYRTEITSSVRNTDIYSTPLFI